jgi:hypothetical protein
MLYTVRFPMTSKMASESGAVQGNDGEDRDVAFAPAGPVLQGCVKCWSAWLQNPGACEFTHTTFDPAKTLSWSTCTGSGRTVRRARSARQGGIERGIEGYGSVKLEDAS